MNALQQFYLPGPTPCCEPPGRDAQMDILVAIFAQLSGVSVTCNNWQSLIAPYACIPRQAQLLVLIALANQIVVNGGTGGGGASPNLSGNYNGISPLAAAGIPAPSTGMIWAEDTSNGALWVGSGGVWTFSGIQV